MLRPEDIILNKIAQDRLTLEQGLDWFDNLDIQEQRKVLTLTSVYLEQSHPDNETIESSLELVPLKATMTPLVILKTQPFKIGLSKIISLPDIEIRKAFITLVSLFKHSDTKRRSIWCINGCAHDWHNLDK